MPTTNSVALTMEVASSGACILQQSDELELDSGRRDNENANECKPLLLKTKIY